MEYYFVINPKSANGRTKKVWSKKLLPVLESKDVKFEYVFTENPLHAIEITHSAVKDQGYKNIISVGGDGTNNEVINGLMAISGQLISEDLKFGVICSGTGSDFIRTMEIPRDPLEALDVVLNGNHKTIDLIKGTFKSLENDENQTRFCLNEVDVGLSSDIVKKVNESSKRLGGKLTFYLISIRKVLTRKFFNVKLKLDDKEWNEYDSFIFAFFGNGRFAGGSMHPCSEAEIDDGLIDVFLVQKLTKRQLLSKLQKFYGTREEMIEVRNSLPGLGYYEKCKKVFLENLDNSRDIWIDFDGEIVGRAPLQLEIVPGVIDVFIP